MTLDLWLKDMHMPSTKLESPLGEDGKLRLCEVRKQLNQVQDYKLIKY